MYKRYLYNEGACQIVPEGYQTPIKHILLENVDLPGNSDGVL